MEQEIKQEQELKPEQEIRNRHHLFAVNFAKFLTDKKTIISCSSLCILIIILLLLFMPTTPKINNYNFHRSNSLFSHMPYDL